MQSSSVENNSALDQSDTVLEQFCCYYAGWCLLKMKAHGFWCYICWVRDAYWEGCRRVYIYSKIQSMWNMLKQADEMSGMECRLVFAGDNPLWTLTWRFPSHGKRPACLDVIWSTFFSCDACRNGGKKTKTKTKHDTCIWNTFYLFSPDLRVKLPFLHEDTCIHVKLTLELLIISSMLKWIFYDSIPLYLS